jgi:hypothetical protein
MAGPTTLPNQDHSPASAARSAGVNSGWYSAPDASKCSLASRPSAAAPSDATPDGTMLANQSSPSASNGASAAPLTTATTRPGSSAPQASACGPPPEWPMTANRSMPSESATAAT